MNDSRKSVRLYGPDNKPLPLNENKESPRIERIKSPKQKAGSKPQAKRFPKTISTFWKWLASLASAAATFLALYAAIPRVSAVPQGNPWNPNDPMSIPIHVSNDGLFTIYSASLVCGIDYLWDSSVNRGISGIGVNASGKFPLGDIAPDGFTDTFCFGFRTPTPRENISGHMNAVLTFRPSFWPWKVTRTFHYGAVTDSQGMVHWIATSK